MNYKYYSPPAPPEQKSTVSGRVLGLRLKALPLTVDSEFSKTPILWGFYGFQNRW